MKYRNKKVEYDHHSFASQLEAAVYNVLIREFPTAEIQTQDHVYLTAARILYIPDFKLIIGNDIFWAEAKSKGTDSISTWRIKKRLWEAGYGPGKLLIYMGTYKNVYLSETIWPKDLNQKEI